MLKKWICYINLNYIIWRRNNEVHISSSPPVSCLCLYMTSYNWKALGDFQPRLWLIKSEIPSFLLHDYLKDLLSTSFSMRQNWELPGWFPQKILLLFHKFCLKCHIHQYISCSFGPKILKVSKKIYTKRVEVDITDIFSVPKAQG